MSSKSPTQEALPAAYATMTLEQQVAQLFMLGYEGLDPGLGQNSYTERFLALGLGGLIFFRDNFEPKPGETRREDGSDCLTAQDIQELLNNLCQAIPSYLPPLLLGIDQEGGQVERLPHTIFPTAITPQAMALTAQPEFMVRSVIGEMATRLASLGFNLNFAPTLDVNLNPLNPIIGVRAFGDDPQTVGDLGLIAMKSYQQAGIIPVGKHFPGHGNGTVDSHYDLPTLEFSEAELAPFQRAIDAGLPVMLIAHGYYPALQTTDEERSLPSSASAAIIQGLLRKKCSFEGVLISDDMCMGAITRHRSAPEAAIACLKAGVDILLYRRSGTSEWEVYEAVLGAFRSGELSQARLMESLHRIARLKADLAVSQTVMSAATGNRQEPAHNSQSPSWQTVDCQQIADTWAKAALTVLLPSDETAKTFMGSKTARLLLVHPDRSFLGNYAWDVATSENLEQVFANAGFTDVTSLSYRHDESEMDLPPRSLSGSDAPAAIVFVAFNSGRFTAQAALAQSIREKYPQAPFLLVSIGSPGDNRVITQATAYWALCSYRPASMRALAEKLAS